MAAVRTFHHARFAADDLVAAKGSRRISLCLPARDEATTVGAIVASVQQALVRDAPLVDEILVLDDHSTDATAQGAGPRSRRRRMPASRRAYSCLNTPRR